MQVEMPYKLPDWDWAGGGTLRESISVYDENAVLLCVRGNFADDQGNNSSSVWVVDTSGYVGEFAAPLDSFLMYHKALDGKLYGAQTTDDSIYTSSADVGFQQQQIVSPMYGTKSAHRLNRIILSFSGLLDADNPITGTNLQGYYLDIMPEEDVGTAPTYTALQTYDLSKCVSGNSIAIVSPKSTYSRYRLRVRCDTSIASPKKPIRLIAVDMDYDRIDPAVTPSVKRLTDSAYTPMSPDLQTLTDATPVFSGATYKQLSFYFSFVNTTTHTSANQASFRFQQDGSTIRQISLNTNPNESRVIVRYLEIDLASSPNVTTQHGQTTIEYPHSQDFVKIEVNYGIVSIGGRPFGRATNPTVERLAYAGSSAGNVQVTTVTARGA